MPHELPSTSIPGDVPNALFVDELMKKPLLLMLGLVSVSVHGLKPMPPSPPLVQPPL